MIWVAVIAVVLLGPVAVGLLSLYVFTYGLNHVDREPEE